MYHALTLYPLTSPPVVYLNRSVKDEAQAFSLHLYECIAETIKSVDLGPINISVPDLTGNRRELQASVSPSSSPTEDDKKFGVTVGLGTSIDVSTPTFKTIGKDLQLGAVSVTLAGVGLEVGYADKVGDDGPALGLGFGFNPPLTAASLQILAFGENSCPAGYYNCKLEKKKCPAGKWCEGGQATKDITKPSLLPDCGGVGNVFSTGNKKGFYCPEGSTSPLGKPIEKFKFIDDIILGEYTACGAGRVCRCEAGYWCPKGSTTPRGKPLSLGTATQSRSLCEIGRECKCPKFYYCPINSAEPRVCGSCACGEKCTNPFCCDKPKPKKEGKSWLEKILSKADDRLDSPELSVGLTINMYWDVNAATFNGSNGFGVDIELPFDFLPNVSLIFLAPPLHCNTGDDYVLSGIGLSTPISTSVPLRSFGDIRDAVQLVKAFLSEAIKSFPPNVKQFVKDVQEDKRTLIAGNAIGFGLGYTYDTSFNKVEGRHEWEKECDKHFENFESDRSLVHLTSRPTASPLLESPASLRRRTQDNSLSVVELPTNQSRALQSTPSLNQQVTNVISVLSAALGSGDLPFCFGPCDKTPRDSSKVIQGVFTSKYTQTCDGVRLSALVSEPITVNKVLYLILAQIDEEFADGTVDFLTTIMLGDFGIENTKLELDVDALQSIELSLSGDPALPELGGDTDDATTFFYNLFDGLKFGITSRIKSSGANLELSASTGPADISDGFSIKDVDGNGFTVFFNYEILPLTATGGLSRTQIVKLGLRLPMRICARDCDSDDPEKLPEIFYLEGEVSVSQVVGSTTPPATLLGGQFELVGEWNNPFGLPILNIYNVVAGAEFDLSKAAPPSFIPPPSSK